MVDVIARGEQLPFRDESFDLVICTQVLQYVADPRLLLLEVYRVLRVGGSLFLSVPSAQIQDAGEECWRFLPAGLRSMLTPFRSVEIESEGGSVAGFFRTVNACLNVFVRYPVARLLYQQTFCRLLNLLGAWTDTLAGKNQQFVVNYSVLAQK
jgi:ubiquinone/menaquinone biosynthesis C-methylase UbiE